MEEFWRIWGPVVPVAIALASFAMLVVRELFKHIKLLTKNNKETVEKHIHESTEATKENSRVTTELVTFLRNGRGRKA